MDHKRELKEEESRDDEKNCWTKIKFCMQAKLRDVDEETSTTKLGIQQSHCISYNKIK